MQRYEKAFRAFGFTDIHYVYEPVAAAYFYAQELKAESTVLVADFGGGTSDFSIVRFEVGAQGLSFTPLSQTGLGIAGDTFDYRIIDNAVSPLLGKMANINLSANVCRYRVIIMRTSHGGTRCSS